MNAHKRHTKLSRVLSALAQGNSYNRFEAAQKLHDHCLHSTAAAIQRRGIPVHREPEIVRGYQGAPTRVKRYRILPDDREKARKLADLLMEKPAVVAAGSKTSGNTETAQQRHVRVQG